MFEYKKIFAVFWSIVFLTMPLITLASTTTTSSGYATPSDTGLPTAMDLSDVIISIMNWLLGIVGVIAVIGFVISGIMYFLAAGDDSRMGEAKKAMTYCIIGVVVALMGYVIIQAVGIMLGAGTDF